MTGSKATRWAFIVVTIALFGWLGYWLVLRYHNSKEFAQFRNAMERREFNKAQALWNKGIEVPPGDAYGQFMQLKERLEKVGKVRVTKWTMKRLSPMNGKDRFAALLDIEDVKPGGTSFGIGLEWQDSGWKLITKHSLLPNYVDEVVGSQGAIE